MTKAEAILLALAPQIQNAVMLINLGLATSQQIRALFARDGHDNEVLDGIDAECDRRIARRS